ncbi:MAG: AMP nucleosidase [Chlamydiae bacterium]|nr:AMP nucleosidase [Chlamydiota bacterium]
MTESKEKQIALESLERYSGSLIEDFQKNLIITNFPFYVDYFASSRNVEIKEGSMFKVAHCPKEKVSILDFKIGSTAAALVVDLCSFVNFETSIFLGMAGGLRRRYKIGDFFVPVAGIRGEGTSNYYFPIEVPALANFLMQRAVTHILEEEKKTHHVGITYTTNKRFWEFDEEFKAKLIASRAQAKELECATLFIASYKRKFTLGALLLISDLPLNLDGIKTKESSKKVYELYTKEHVELGIKILKHAQTMLRRKSKGSYRATDSDV